MTSVDDAFQSGLFDDDFNENEPLDSSRSEWHEMLSAPLFTHSALQSVAGEKEIHSSSFNIRRSNVSKFAICFLWSSWATCHRVWCSLFFTHKKYRAYEFKHAVHDYDLRSSGGGKVTHRFRYH